MFIVLFFISNLRHPEFALTICSFGQQSSTKIGQFRLQFIRALKDALGDSLCPGIIKASFQRAGIYNEFYHERCVSRLPSRVAEAKALGSEESEEVKKPRQLFIEMTSEAYIESLRMKEGKRSSLTAVDRASPHRTSTRLLRSTPQRTSSPSLRSTPRRTSTPSLRSTPRRTSTPSLRSTPHRTSSPSLRSTPPRPSSSSLKSTPHTTFILQHNSGAASLSTPLSGTPHLLSSTVNNTFNDTSNLGSLPKRIAVLEEEDARVEKTIKRIRAQLSSEEETSSDSASSDMGSDEEVPPPRYPFRRNRLSTLL